MNLSGGRKRWLVVALVVIALIVAGLLIAGPLAASYATRQIRNKFGDQTQVAQLHVRLFPSIRISAEKIVVPVKDGTGPLISIARVTGETNWVSALAGHVREVRVEGLRITIPPRRDGNGLHSENKPKKARFTVDRVIADGALLEIEPKQTGKEPLVFDLYTLTLHGAGADQAMMFETIMKNARPPGEIHSGGTFGPWNFDEPAATPVAGSYTFRNADLAVFKGISGVLSSDGKYHGVLDHIEVDGSTDTPNFMLLAGGNPVDLACQFHAVVDGTDGNTYLQPVEGHFGGSTVIARGEVIRQDHDGRLVKLDATVTGGRLEDMLRLAVKSPDLMTGALSFESTIVIPPGKDIEVVQKLRLDGQFTVNQAHFSKLNVQEKVNELSHRSRGEPQEGSSGDVASDFRGHFKLNHGVMTFTGLGFTVPGRAHRLERHLRPAG